MLNVIDLVMLIATAALLIRSGFRAWRVRNSFLKWLLRHADQYAGSKNKQAPNHDLEGGRDEWRVHVAVAHPGDDAELDHDD